MTYGETTRNAVVATLHNNLHHSSNKAGDFRSIHLNQEAATTSSAWNKQADGTDGLNKMVNAGLVVQKIRQAPWKQQRQWVGSFMLGLVLVALVAGIYLNITVRATLAGRQIMMLQSEMTLNHRTISDLETRLASLTSVASMQARAEALGFQPATPAEITYVRVEGYIPRPAVDMSVRGAGSKQNPVILPAYTESLFDWITHTLVDSAANQGSQ
jgi:hypothetical protein